MQIINNNNAKCEEEKKTNKEEKSLIKLFSINIDTKSKWIKLNKEKISQNTNPNKKIDSLVRSKNF